MATTFTGLRVQDTYNAIIKIGDNSTLTGTGKLLSDGFGNNSNLYLSTTSLGIGVAPTENLHISGSMRLTGSFKDKDNQSGTTGQVLTSTATGTDWKTISDIDGVTSATGGTANYVPIFTSARNIENSIIQASATLVTISGNLDVNGTVTYIDTIDLSVKDPLIKLANANVSNTLDIGFYGKYVVSATTKYLGLYSDASDSNKFRLFTGLETEPTTVVDSSDTTFAVGTLIANLEGNVTGNLTGNVTGGTISGTSGTFSASVTAAGNSNSFGNTTTAALTATSGTFSASVIASGNSNSFGTTTINSDTGLKIHSLTDQTNATITFSSLIPSLAQKGFISYNHLDTASYGSGNSFVINGTEATMTILAEGKLMFKEGLYIKPATGTGAGTLIISSTGAISATTGSFSGLVTGIAPTADLNFATKKYVDDNIVPAQSLSNVLSVGNTSGANDIIMADSQKILVGTDSDLELWFNGDGYLRNNTGDLYIQNLANDKNTVFQSDDGSGGIVEYFRVDGSTSRIVYGRSIQVVDNVSIFLGNSATNTDGYLKWDSTASQIFIGGNSKFLNDLYVSGATSMSGTLTMNANNINMVNGSITNANLLSFNEPGGNEGIEWLTGNLWKIFESPNNFGNDAGNLQFVKDTTRSMTLDTSSNLYTLGGLDSASLTSRGTAVINGQTTIKSNDGLVLYTETSAASLKPKITFSTLPDNPVQFGVIEYTHLDSLSQGGGHSFSFVGDDDVNDNLTIIGGDGTKTGTYISTSRALTTNADYGFYGDVNTGMYRPANHQLGLLANGSRKLLVSSAGVNIQNGVLLVESLGSAAAPCIGVGDTDTGFYDGGSNIIGFTSGGVSSATIDGTTASFVNNITAGGSISGTSGTFSASISASGNSNSFGNTTVGALTASSGTFSASVTASGNSNSFGTTTITNLTTTTSFAATNSIIVNSTGTAGLYLRGDSNNTGDGGQLDAVIEMTQDANTHGFELGSYNYSGYSEFAIKQLTDDGSGGFNKSNVLRSSKSNDVNVGGLTKDGSTVWRRLGAGVSASMFSRETGVADAMFSNNLYIGSDNVDKRLVAGGAARIFMNDDITRFQYSGTSTANSGVSWTESMRIKNNGNIGINDTDPTYRLSVYHPTTNVTAQFHSGDNQAWISVRDDGFTTYGAMLGCDHDSGLNVILGDNAANKRLTIKNAGQVGIGYLNSSSYFAQFDVLANLSDNWAGRFENTNAGGYGVLAKIAGTTANEFIFEARTGTTSVLKINGDGNSNFIGNVNITGGTTNGLNITTSGTQDTININRAANNDNAITKYQTASVDKWIVGLRNTGDDNFRFYSYGTSSDVLTINQANGNVGINYNNPQSKLHVLGSVRFDSYSVSDPDATSRARYPADVMLTHYTGNGVSIIGGQGGYTGCGLTIGEETGRTTAFKFIRGVSDTNGSPAEEFWIDGIGQAYFAGSTTIGGSLVVNNLLTINIDDISTGENRGLKIVNTQGVDQQWNITTGVTGAENETFCIRDATGNVNALKLEIGTGNANFSGNVELNDSGQLQLGTGNDTQVYHNGSHLFIDNSVGTSYIRNTSTGSILLRNSTGGDIQFDNEFAGNILFNTSNIQRMSISSGGTVHANLRMDVGTTTWQSFANNPVAKLNVETPSGDNAIIIYNTQENFAYLKFIDSQSNGSQWSRIGFSSGAGNPFVINNMGTDAIYILSSGNIGIKKTSGISYALDVTGTIRASVDVIAYSDRRVKENIITIDNALNKVTKLRGVTYTRKDIEDKSTKIGVIAQEVLEVLPEVVKKDDDGMYGVDYGKMAGVFIEAIKELENRVKELENKSCKCK